MMVDTVEAPDPTTVVFHLKFATAAFLPALADPFSWIYKKQILDKDPRSPRPKSPSRDRRQALKLEKSAYKRSKNVYAGTRPAEFR
jgi:ABC-type transport system substrate-binding protein